MSSVIPFEVQRTITLRPLSCGRDSSQYVSAPSVRTSERPMDWATIRSEVMGDFQEPHGAVSILLQFDTQDASGEYRTATLVKDEAENVVPIGRGATARAN